MQNASSQNKDCEPAVGFILGEFETSHAYFNWFKFCTCAITGNISIDDPIDLAMVKSISEIGQVMGKQIIAEYVESELVLEKLKEMGLNYAQGFYLGAPVALQDMNFDTGSVQPAS